MDSLKLTIISHVNPYIIDLDDGNKFTFEARIFDFGEVFYTVYTLVCYETKEWSELEWVDDNISEATDRLNRIFSIFKPFDLKVLRFDKEYEVDYIKDIYVKWV